MTVYQIGSKGDEVRQIQTRLKELSLYAGVIDGDFGGGTFVAVKKFQQAQHLEADGKVGATTWAKLFPPKNGVGGTILEAAIVKKPLEYRCLALTGAFETGMPIPDCSAGVSGDFDGQGISFGVLQWCIGQNSLQPLLQTMAGAHPDEFSEIFDDHTGELRAMLHASHTEQMAWARRIQNLSNFVLNEPWRGMFKTLGRRESFQQIEVEAAGKLFDAARALCVEYGVHSERAVALLFDIKTQNGSISELVKAQIERDFTRLAAGSGEVERLRIIANRRAEASNPRWVEDVRTRKLTIANGEGTVHGSHFDLAGQYGIRLVPVV